MKREEKYLIEICSAYLKKEKISLDESVDYSRLFLLSKEQNLVAIVFCVINNAYNKNIVESKIFRSFENGFLETVMRYDRQSAVIRETDKCLSRNEIRHVFFKGAQIRNFYPVKQARAMGDIDILIDEKNREKVKKVLTSSSYELRNSNGPVYDYVKDGVLIEMHTKIISGKVGDSSAQLLFSDAVEHAHFDGFSGFFPADYHFAYLIAHTAHHFWFYGAGIKLILDLAVMQLNFDIDTEHVLEILRGAGLEQFAKTIMTLCYEMFSVGKRFDGVNCEKALEFVASCGAFGNARSRNTAAVIERKELEEGKKTGKIVTRMRLLFPTYEKLKNIPYINFIEGKKYLVPAAWIYRIFYNITHRKEFLKSSVSQIGSDKTHNEAQEELEFFKEIGLSQQRKP